MSRRPTTPNASASGALWGSPTERCSATSATRWATPIGSVRDGVWLEWFRTVFGDERQDYGTCLQMHHDEGPPSDWRERFVSGHASAHPWEDFAETWAHYLHLVDTLETAAAFGLRVRPRAGRDAALVTEIDFDAYRQTDFDALIQAWLPLTYAVNSLNHSMGQPDLYPFVLSVMGQAALRPRPHSPK